jgi:dienelactone hydrolase
MIRTITAILAAVLVTLALLRIEAQTHGISVERGHVGTIPVTVFARPDAAPAPAVLIAHGFAGSQQLMAPFATTLARAGLVAVTLDLAGHGRNPAPLTGDVTTAEGATATLLREMEAVSAFARAHPRSDGRLALIGHSMASDLVVRQAIADRDVAAVVAVSLFSPEVTETEPRNLLVVTGAWEPGLTDEALRVAGLGTGAPAAPSTTRGDLSDGSARRAVLAPGVEHVGVLFSATTLTETARWLTAAFGIDGPIEPDTRGRWIAPWFLGAALLAWALARSLPRLAPPATAMAPRRGAFALAAIVPAVLTPLIAVWLPEGLLPVPVADYLSLHFLLYGGFTAALLWRLRWPWPARVRPLPLALAALACVGFALVVLYLPLDRYVTAFVPQPARLPLVAMLALGLLAWFLADEALTRAPTAPRLAYPLTKLAFLLSLAIAIALDTPRLFFLILILPVMLLFFILFGLFSRWTFTATGSPLPAALASALLFAWAIGVTFPVLGS